MNASQVSQNEPTSPVISHVEENRFIIQLNRPDKKNAIDWQTLLCLQDAIEEAERTPNVRVVVLWGGENAGFSSGIDLNLFPEIADVFGSNWRERMLNISAAFQAVLTRLERCSLPTIALINRYAIGLGFELALACDFRFVAEGTRLYLPETRMGIIPDVGGTTRLTRLFGPARAKEYIMSGKDIDLELAERIGAINAIVSDDELYSAAISLSEDISRSAPLAVFYTKRIVDGLADIDRGLQLEAWAQNNLIKTQDFLIGVQAALSKSSPHWKGE